MSSELTGNTIILLKIAGRIKSILEDEQLYLHIKLKIITGYMVSPHIPRRI